MTDSSFFKSQIQTKLTINPSNDIYEQEADSVAEKVMRMPDKKAKPLFFQPKAIPITPIQKKCAACEQEEKLQRKEDEEEEEPIQTKSSKVFDVQRKCSHCEEEDKKLQPKTDNGSFGGNAAPSIVNDVISLTGQPMDAGTRDFMESRFGYDFGSVQIHNDSLAHQSSSKIDALAYTHGDHIVFGTGQYQPNTTEGKLLIAHELAHTVQQGANKIVQRQSIDDDEPPKLAPGAIGSEPLDDPFPDLEGNFLEFDAQDSIINFDPQCPSVPTRLGDVIPYPQCPSLTEIIDGQKFYFCKGSDVLTPQEELSEIIVFARNQPALSFFKIVGYSSREGTPAQNSNLACHRAKRIGRILLDAGVKSQRISIFNGGVTERFGSGAKEENRKKNRVAVIKVQSEPEEPVPEILPTDHKGIVTEALGKILRGEYHLAADAYISYWTCGHIPSLIRAVQQTTIQIEGEAGVKDINRKQSSRDVFPEESIGVPISEGLNTITLAKELFEMENPIECVASRIIDLSFHHVARPNIPNHSEVHKAGNYLAEIAGFKPCRKKAENYGDESQPLKPGKQVWPSPTHDPRKDMHPGCAREKLSSPIGFGEKSNDISTPEFTIENFITNFNNGSSKIKIDSPGKQQQIAIGAPDKAFYAKARVKPSKDIPTIGNYEIGFTQTLARYIAFFEYVSGHQLVLTMPVPLLDGRSNHDGFAPKRPWYYPPQKSSKTGVDIEMSDAPKVPMPYNYLNIPKVIFEEMDLGVKDENTGMDKPFGPYYPTIKTNPINKAQVDYTFNTWVIARHNNAPLDIFSTQFIKGLSWKLRMTADVTGLSASGTSNIQASDLTDHSKMQMTDPIPNDFDRFPEILGFYPPISRSTAGGLSFPEYHAEVEKIAKPLRRKHKLTDLITIHIKIDKQTGRVKLPVVSKTGTEIPVSVVSNSGSQKNKDEFSKELFILIRKYLVIAPPKSGAADIGDIPIGLVPLE